jgi:hypothetical protein
VAVVVWRLGVAVVVASWLPTRRWGGRGKDRGGGRGRARRVGVEGTERGDAGTDRVIVGLGLRLRLLRLRGSVTTADAGV